MGSPTTEKLNPSNAGISGAEITCRMSVFCSTSCPVEIVVIEERGGGESGGFDAQNAGTQR